MEDDIMKKRLRGSVNKTIKIILKSNGWKYEGKLTNFDEKYLELLDFKSNCYKIVSISDVDNLEVRG